MSKNPELFDAIMLIAKTDGSAYELLCQGRARPKQAASWAMGEYRKHEMQRIREECAEIADEVTDAIDRWVAEANVEVSR